MATVAASVQRGARTRFPALSSAAVAGPVLIVAVILAWVMAPRWYAYHGNPTGFVRFGQAYAPYTHPPPDAVLGGPAGYDGQWFWVLANDPLLAHNGTIASLSRARQAFRLERMAYPMLAYALAAGQRQAIPWSMLAVNALAILGVTAAFAWYARRRGWSPWWALAVGMLPGLMMGALRDLSDPLAVATMFGGLLMWELGRRWAAAALLSVAVLAREPMILALGAVAADAAASWWRARYERGSFARAARRAWPALVVPAAAFAVWQAYVDVRYGGNAAATSSGTAFVPPLTNFIAEVGHALHRGSVLGTAWDLIYLGLTLTGIATALALLRRGVSASAVAAGIFGVIMVVLVFGDDWAYTRYSAALFAPLLLTGLERRSRLALTLCVIAAAMSPLVPLVVSG